MNLAQGPTLPQPLFLIVISLLLQLLHKIVLLVLLLEIMMLSCIQKQGNLDSHCKRFGVFSSHFRIILPMSHHLN